MIKYFCAFLYALILCFNINAQIHSHSHNHKHHGLHHWEIPSKDPDRIILTFNGDPATKRAVTWRTDSSVEKAQAQIAVASVNSSFLFKMQPLILHQLKSLIWVCINQIIL